MISVQSVIYLDDCGVGSGGEARGMGSVCTVQREILKERAAGEMNDDAWGRGGGHGRRVRRWTVYADDASV